MHFQPKVPAHGLVEDMQCKHHQVGYHQEHSRQQSRAKIFFIEDFSIFNEMLTESKSP